MFARVLVIACLTVGCDPAPRPPTPTKAPVAAATPAPTASSERPDGKRCLPLVSGCGCAYVCASTFQLNVDGTHEVVHDFQDSRLDAAAVERWCFDESGRGSPAGTRWSRSASTGVCQDVFFDRTPCGGECIPSMKWLGCRWLDDRCTAD